MAEADGGAFSKEYSHEFQVECAYGEDTLLITDEKAQNIEVADLMHEHKNPNEAEAELKEVEVKRGLSVEENADAHNCEDWRILKTVVFKLESSGFVGVCIRGDLQVSKDKVAAYFGEKVFAASPEELESIGLVQGFISPVNNDKIDFIGDLSVDTVNNYVTGANKQDLDVTGVNVGRDFKLKDIVHLADISDYEGIKEVKAIEVGNIFKLGTKFSEPANLTFNDADGNVQHVIMGCYGIGNTRLMGTIAELHSDDSGLMWPKNVAPFHVHLVHLGNNEDVIDAAEDLYEDLKEAGYEVLYDDRDAGPGTKLADSDLIGIPVRIVIGNKTIGEQSCEWKLRSESDASMVKLDDVASKLKDFYA
jgi:prolyl-tRNA synthetase